MKAVFESKRDPWLVLVLSGSILFMLLVSAMVVASMPSHSRIATAGILGIMAIAYGMLIGYALWKCRYVLSSDSLLIDVSFGAKTIGIGSIQTVEPTRDPASSPALSLDRLRVVYSDGAERREVLISPADKDGFLRALEDRDRSLIYREGCIKRVTAAGTS
jgi:hypothetical protein